MRLQCASPLLESRFGCNAASKYKGPYYIQMLNDLPEGPLRAEPRFKKPPFATPLESSGLPGPESCSASVPGAIWWTSLPVSNLSASPGSKGENQAGRLLFTVIYIYIHIYIYVYIHIYIHTQTCVYIYMLPPLMYLLFVCVGIMLVLHFVCF